MAGVMKPYIVRQGDYLAKLAFVHAFDADTVWNDAKNEDLRKLRPDPNILAPGDILFIPDKGEEPLAIQKGVENSYAAEVPKVEVRVRFRSGTGRFNNVNFTIEGPATPPEGTTDAEGWLMVSVPVHTAELRVVFPDLKEDYTLLVGHMDPHTEDSGARARLTHLGYMLPSPRAFFGHDIPGYALDDDDERLAAAVRAFQVDQSLTATGVLDDQTRKALAAAHGS